MKQQRRRREARLPNVDFVPFSRPEAWEAANDILTVVEDLGLVPGPGFGKGEGPPEAPEKPEGVGDLPAPEGGKPPDVRNIPEDVDVGAEKGLGKPAPQEGDGDEQKSKEELLYIWESGRTSDVKMMEKYSSGEMELKDVEWEVNWLTSLDVDDLEDVVSGRRAVVEEEELVDFLEKQGIKSSSVFDSSDYTVSDLPLNELDSRGKQRIAMHLGMGGSEAGIPYVDAIDQIEVLQKYWGLNDREMLSILREIYYPEALDDFIAGTKDDNIPDLTENAVELADGTIITKEDAAYALAVLTLGQPLSGYLDEGNPALGYRGALVPVMAGEGEAGFDHVIAGLEGFFNPANEGGDLEMKEGLKKTFIEEVLGSEIIKAGEAVTWEGDLGGVVYELIKIPGISLNEVYDISMPRQDFEGDILATVLYTQLLEEDKIGLGEGLRALYDPEQPYYNDRYELFAVKILSEVVEGDKRIGEYTISDFVDPETGNINPAVKEAFINRHRINVKNYAIGLLFPDTFALIEGVINDPEERLRELGVDLPQMDQYAYNVLDRFLTDLEERLKQEK